MVIWRHKFKWYFKQDGLWFQSIKLFAGKGHRTIKSLLFSSVENEFFEMNIHAENEEQNFDA